MTIYEILLSFKSGKLTLGQAEDLLEYDKDLRDALRYRPNLWQICKARWPLIRPKEVKILQLLVTRESISHEGLLLNTEIKGDTSLKVYISRLRTYTKAQIICDYGNGYSMKPEDRKRLKQELEI